jgi:multidrug efflux pump subunit AcrB
VEQARERGAALHEAVVEAGLARLRPILLTTVTTVGGLIPLALFGGVLFESMAWSMIAGLSWATLLTLVVIPVFYSLLLPDKQELWQTAAQGC